MVGGEKVYKLFSTTEDKQNLTDVFNIQNNFECNLGGNVEGSGNYTVVQFCEKNSSSEKTYVIKTLYNKQFKNDTILEYNNYKYYLYLIQRRFFNNYVRLNGIYENKVFEHITPFIVSANNVYLLEEKTDCDLEQYIYKNTSYSIGKTNKDKAGIVKNLVEALDYLFNTLEVTHNDIKPANINIINGKAYLADLDFYDEKYIRSKYGTIEYISKAKLLAAIDNSKPVHEECDYYSMGCVIYELLTNQILCLEVIDNLSREEMSENNIIVRNDRNNAKIVVLNGSVDRKIIDVCNEFIKSTEYNEDPHYRYMVNQLIRMFTIGGNIPENNTDLTSIAYNEYMCTHPDTLKLYSQYMKTYTRTEQAFIDRKEIIDGKKKSPYKEAILYEHGLYNKLFEKEIVKIINVFIKNNITKLEQYSQCEFKKFLKRFRNPCKHITRELLQIVDKYNTANTESKLPRDEFKLYFEINYYLKNECMKKR